MRILIYGSRPDGHAKVVLELIEALDFECVGLIDDFPENRDRKLKRLKVLGGKSELASLAAERADALAFGFGEGAPRRELLATVAAAGLELPTLVHPSAIISRSARIGPGAQVMAGAQIGPDALIERAALVNTGAIVEHDVKVGAGVSVGPGATLAGRVIVNEDATVGAGAVVIPDVEIGRGAVVGAGGAVIRDVGQCLAVAGVPARPIATQ